MIKNVIFDFGNVIAKFDGKTIIEKIYGGSASFDELAPIIFENWSALDSGDADYDEYTNRAVERVPAALIEPTKIFFRDWYKYLPYTDGIEEVIETLKNDGYRLYILSNAPSYFSQKSSSFKVTEKFDGIIFSGDIKLVKPDRRIYETLLERFSLKPEECVFADDLEQNIEAARTLGINGYLFKNDARAFLEYIKKGCKS